MGVLVRGSLITAFALISTIPVVAQTRFLFATALSPMVQNARADEDGLSRIADPIELRRFVQTGLLVPVPASGRYHYLKGVAPQYRYLRPWSKHFLNRVGSQYYTKFHKRLRVTSMVRTSQLQIRMARYNGNAAPATGPTQSSHLTGATLDISKAPMGPAERAWMRSTLLSLRSEGYAYGIEERAQPTFHVMVYKNYPVFSQASAASKVKVKVKSARYRKVARRHRRR